MLPRFRAFDLLNLLTTLKQSITHILQVHKCLHRPLCAEASYKDETVLLATFSRGTELAISPFTEHPGGAKIAR